MRKLGRVARQATRRHAFVVRLALAVTVSVALLMLASQLFFTHTASRELIQQDARFYAVDATVLETAYREGSDPVDGMDDVLDLVDSMGDRLGIEYVTLLDSRGKVVDAPRDAGIETPRGVDTYVPARDHEVVVKQDGPRFDFVVPVFLAGERLTLEVDADGQMIQERISALRDETLVFSTVALLVALLMWRGQWPGDRLSRSAARTRLCRDRGG